MGKYTQCVTKRDLMTSLPCYHVHFISALALHKELHCSLLMQFNSFWTTTEACDQEE